MKAEFIGYYDPSKEELDKGWNEGMVVFDANALLNLYRYTANTRDDLFQVIEKLKDRLYLPHQVGLEYQNNRVSVINAMESAYDKMYEELNKEVDEGVTNIVNQYKRHPSIKIDELQKHFSPFLKKIKDDLDNQKKSHPDYSNKDIIREKLDKLYEKKVGQELTDQELETLYKAGKERYGKQIPPGYRDLKNKEKRGDRHVYGDYIIWDDLIKYAKKEKKTVILITDDRKDDWWEIENGKTLGPKRQLVKEFFDKTGYRLLMYNADQFLKFAKQRKLVETIKEESIKEVQEVRKSDESIYTNSAIFYTKPLTFDPASGSILAGSSFLSNNLLSSGNPISGNILTMTEPVQNLDNICYYQPRLFAVPTESGTGLQNLIFWPNSSGSFLAYPSNIIGIDPRFPSFVAARPAEGSGSDSAAPGEHHKPNEEPPKSQ